MQLSQRNNEVNACIYIGIDRGARRRWGMTDIHERHTICRDV